jgi:hypothetical protein
MALARCEDHPPTKPEKYARFALPIGFPRTAAICGRVECQRPARIWLTETETRDHARGMRVFRLDTHTIKVRVSDEPISN